MLKSHKAKYLLGNSSELWKAPRPCSHASLILSIEEPYDLEDEPPLCIISCPPSPTLCTAPAVPATSAQALTSLAQVK